MLLPDYKGFDITYVGRQQKIGNKIMDMVFIAYNKEKNWKELIIVELKRMELTDYCVGQALGYKSMIENIADKLGYDNVVAYVGGSNANISVKYNSDPNLKFFEFKHHLSFSKTDYYYNDEYLEELEKDSEHLSFSTNVKM